MQFVIFHENLFIREISSKCNVSIKMPPREQLSTLVTIVGTEANANKAKLEIENAIGIFYQILFRSFNN